MSLVVLERAAGTVTQVPSPFVAESQVASPVWEWLLLRPDVLGVGAEVDAGCGIADLVAGCSCNHPLPTREAFDDPLTTQLLGMAQRPVSESALRRWAPYGWRSLRQRRIEPLVAVGLLVASSRDDEIHYTATVDAADPFTRLVAVELKLKDWRRAVAQAGRYRLFAESSYVAMPTSRISAALVVEARRAQVGVLAVDAEQPVQLIEPAPEREPLQPQRRRWAAEQLLRALRHPSPRAAGSPIR